MYKLTSEKRKKKPTVILLINILKKYYSRFAQYKQLMEL